MRNLTISEALDILEDGEFHSLAYVSANRAKKAGGQIVRIAAGRIVKHEQAHLPPESRGSAADTKSQNHSEHATRNILLANGQRRKMHIYTLFAVENLPVI